VRLVRSPVTNCRADTALVTTADPTERDLELYPSGAFLISPVRLITAIQFLDIIRLVSIIRFLAIV
jgi:hypothetical protein